MAMRRLQETTIAFMFAALASSSPIANAQNQPDSAAPAQTTAPDQAEWIGLPFKNLAEFENLIPVDMTRGDLVEALGRPVTIMPGRGSDQVYFYEYSAADGSRITATIVVREGAVFIRRLYISSPSGPPTRVN